MNYADIKRIDTANGTGVRVSLFVSGCNHHCKNCFNQEAWDFNYGKLFTEEQIEEILGYLDHEYIAGLTLLGGEPFERDNQIGLLPLLRKVKAKFPEKNIWCFTGFYYDTEIMEKMYPRWQCTREMLSYIDVLVDGRFEEDKKDLTLKFKGSSNQRTIDVQESLKEGKIVLHEFEETKM